MADEELVARLKRSINEWNQWREQNPDVKLDLSEAGYKLIGVNLSRADFRRVNLSRAYLRSADLRSADFSGADLSGAYLCGADLSGAYLGADLNNANLYRANLSGANLNHADLSGANLSNADFTRSIFGRTLFAEVDLSTVQGLETAEHQGPSTININSVILPHDEPTRTHFLQRVGFTKTQIEYLPSLLVDRPIQYHSLFISYNHQDEAIAKRLYTDLLENNVPCWFAPHDLPPGIIMTRGIEEAIHLHDKLLLILSANALRSNWVQMEVEVALNKEATTGKAILFPIRLDDTVLESTTLWATHLRQRKIEDFTGWQKEQCYQGAFTLLLRHLKTDPSPPHNLPKRT